MTERVASNEAPGHEQGQRTLSQRTHDAPLAGVRVLDLSGYIAAPYGCTLLADQGAEVIKIEPPRGDNLRRYPSTLASESRAFLGVNRGKRGLIVDLKHDDGRDLLLRMVRDVDVLVHNFRPAVPARLGMDYETLRELNDRLIYCAVTGYGEHGPMKDRAGYDQVLQAMTGICAAQNTVSEPQLVYGSPVDYYAAALLAGAVSSALYDRERSGQGRYVGISLLRSALAMQSARLVWAREEGREVSRDMRSGGITGLHPTRHGTLYLSANTPHFWTALCELVGRPELATDPRYDSIRKRAALAHEIVPVIREALLTRSAEDWQELFGEQVPCAVVGEVEDMFDHEQVEAEGMIEGFTHPVVGPYRGLSGAFRFGAPGEAIDGQDREPRAAPGFGQHTDEVLAQFGFSAGEIAELRDKEVVA